MLGLQLPFTNGGPKAVTEIAELRIYPIKSCRGIKLDSWQMTTQGLDLDRRWMFADAETRKFVTIRDVRQMTLIDLAIVPAAWEVEGSQEMLRLSIRGTDVSVSIPSRPTAGWLAEHTRVQTVNIWGEDTDGHAYSDEVNRPFSDFLGRRVVLVYKGPTARITEAAGREANVNFPDFMPVLIANEASIRELNTRLKNKGVDEITIERFRPNIIVKGATSDEGGEGEESALPVAWSEDNWKTARVINRPDVRGLSSYLTSNALEIDVCTYCARCQVPNVDPATAEKHPKEPWDTLVSYRRVDPNVKYKPCFGMLSAPRNEGPIAVGMRFAVTAFK